VNYPFNKRHISHASNALDVKIVCDINNKKARYNLAEHNGVTPQRNTLKTNEKLKASEKLEAT